jgi:hypothetical protein
MSHGIHARPDRRARPTRRKRVTAGSDRSLPAVAVRYLTRKASRSTVSACRPRPVVTASM